MYSSTCEAVATQRSSENNQSWRQVSSSAVGRLHDNESPCSTAATISAKFSTSWQVPCNLWKAAPQIDLARSRYRTYRTPFHSLRDASRIEQYLATTWTASDSRTKIIWRMHHREGIAAVLLCRGLLSGQVAHKSPRCKGMHQSGDKTSHVLETGTDVGLV